MPEIPVVSLDFRWQKQVESARQSFERGKYEECIEKAAPVLQEFPACFAVRRLIHAAQSKTADRQTGLFGKLVSTVSSAPFMFSGNSSLKENPLNSVATADRLLLKDRHNVAALVLLGQASLALGWNETAAFAFENAREHEPDRPDILLGLGQAYLAAGRGRDAVIVARGLVQLQPNHAEAQALFRNASIAVTVEKGKWEGGGDYRSKLNDEERAQALERAAKWKKPGQP